MNAGHELIDPRSGAWDPGQRTSTDICGCRTNPPILAAFLSVNTPYRRPLRFLAAPVHAGFQGHGHCGVAFAVSHAAFVYKIINFAGPCVLFLICG